MDNVNYNEDIDLASADFDKQTAPFEHSGVSGSLPVNFILLSDAVNGDYIAVDVNSIIAYYVKREKGHAHATEVILKDNVRFLVAEDFETVSNLIG